MSDIMWLLNTIAFMLVWLGVFGYVLCWRDYLISCARESMVEPATQRYQCSECDCLCAVLVPASLEPPHLCIYSFMRRAKWRFIILQTRGGDE